MPADSDDAATLVVTDDLLPDAVEWYTVEVLAVAHLNAAEVKAHDGRPVAAGLKDIAAAVLVLPADAVERIVLVPEHAALLLQGVKAAEQRFTRRRLRLAATNKYQPHEG